MTHAEDYGLGIAVAGKWFVGESKEVSEVPDAESGDCQSGIADASGLECFWNSDAWREDAGCGGDSRSGR